MIDLTDYSAEQLGVLRAALEDLPYAVSADLIREIDDLFGTPAVSDAGRPSDTLEVTFAYDPPRDPGDGTLWLDRDALELLIWTSAAGWRPVGEGPAGPERRTELRNLIAGAEASSIKRRER